MTGTEFQHRLWDAWLTLQREYVRRGRERPTQKWLAQAMTEAGSPIGQGGVSEWMRGKAAPATCRVYVTLAKVLSWGERGSSGWIDPGWLAFGEDSDAPPPDFHGGAQWTTIPRGDA